MRHQAILRLSVSLLLLAACGDDAATAGKDAAVSGNAAADSGKGTDAAEPIPAGQPVELDWACNNPTYACSDIECSKSFYAGPLAIEGNDQQHFYVDYPCDLKTGDEVTLVLNLHGGGSFANWQRHYFPLKDFTDEFRLIVVHPQALTHESEAGGKSTRWTVDGADDQYIEDVMAFVDETFSKLVHVKRFWVVGHSNGGRYGKEVACWKDKFAWPVTGHVNLSGTSNANGDFGVACDINFIFSVGEEEVTLTPPDPNPVAERLGCGARSAAEQIVDTVAGQIYDNSGRVMREGWGGKPAPGTSETFTYPDCNDELVVADYVRLAKGHTEGYEPKLTRHILERMMAAPAP